MTYNQYWLPYLPLSTSLLILVLGFLVFAKNRYTLINKIFFLFALSIFVWLFFYSLAYLSRDPILTKFWFKIGYLGVFFIPTTWLHFTFSFLKKDKITPIIIGFYLISIFLGILTLSSEWFIIGLYEYPWSY